MDTIELRTAFEKEQHDHPFAFLYDSIFATLRQAIILEQFAPGRKLKDGDIAVLLNVSRTPVRRAFSMLIDEGLLEYANEREYVVPPPTLRSLLDIMVFRETMESVMVYHAAKNATSRDISELWHLLQAYKIPDDSPERLQKTFNAEVAFHQKIQELCDNPYLTEAYRRNLTAIYRSIYFNNKAHNRKFQRIDSKRIENVTAYEMHLQIYYAIKCGNGRMGMEAVYSHLRKLDFRKINFERLF